jgi:hypothetical protein
MMQPGSAALSGTRKKINPGNDLLSHGNRSTIGAGELNCRVRDGNGCDLSAIVTRISYFIFNFLAFIS